MLSTRRVSTLVLLLLATVTAVFSAAGAVADPEQAVIEWAVANGAEVGFYIGKECEDCVRGALASRAYSKGEVVAVLPFSLGISVKYRPDQELMYRGEFAVEVLTRMHTDPGFNRTWGVYWDSLPPPEEVLSTDRYTDEDFQMAQSEWLVEHSKAIQRKVRLYHDNLAQQMSSHPFNVSLDTFSYVAALAVTRSLELDLRGSRYKVLMPILDIMNHAEFGNVEWATEEHITIRAVKRIKKGEELLHNYQPSVTHRPDLCFATYGFVPVRNPPLLCAQDLPNFQYKDPFRHTARTDDRYVKNSGGAMRKEVQRLQGILDSLPTTLEEDQQLLQEAEGRARLFLQLRVERKRALRHRIRHLKREMLIEKLFIGGGGGTIVLLGLWIYRRTQREGEAAGGAKPRAGGRGRDSRKRR